MEAFKLEYVSNLLCQEDKIGIVKNIAEMKDKEMLHNIAKNYNWDNGFEVPRCILKNMHCDMGTALMMFYDADGYRVLVDKNEVNNPNLRQWSNFIMEIYRKIFKRDFKTNTIFYTPPLSSVQIYNLMKELPKTETVFWEACGSSADSAGIPQA